MDPCQSRRRGIRRRKFLGVLAVLELYPRLCASGDAIRPPLVIVVYVSGLEAYSETVGGLRTRLAGFVPAPVFIDLKSPGAEAELSGLLNTAQPSVVISVGTEPFGIVSSHKVDGAIVPTMILRSDRSRGSQFPTGAQRLPSVYLDVPLASLLNELKILLPSRSRCGVIRNSVRGDPDPSPPGQVRQQGFTLETALCSRPEDLVKSFLSLKGKADFVVLFPDSSLYNNTTVRPLILASLESRLPIVGFSSSFVRAGAALGVYPDFHDVGVQTADVVQKVIAGKTGLPDESPRKLQVAINQRVLRLLGLNCNETPGLVIFR